MVNVTAVSTSDLPPREPVFIVGGEVWHMLHLRLPSGRVVELSARAAAELYRPLAGVMPGAAEPPVHPAAPANPAARAGAAGPWCDLCGLPALPAPRYMAGVPTWTLHLCAMCDGQLPPREEPR
jgi:hypothetical protein